MMTIWRDEHGTRYWYWLEGRRCEVAPALALQYASSGRARIRTVDATQILIGQTAALEKERRQPWRF